MDSILASAAIFRGVDPGAVRALTRGLRATAVSSGHIFFEEGQQGDRMYIVISGKVKIGRASPDRREYFVTVRGPSESFGELSVFDPGPRTSTATAISDVSVAAIEGTTLREWVADRPEVADRLLRVLARRLRRTDDLLSDLIFTDVPGRLAKQLLSLAQQFGVQEDGAMRVTHGLTQEELGQLVGSSRETVNKALNDFSQRGWIRLEGKSVVIAESDSLSRRAR